MDWLLYALIRFVSLSSRKGGILINDVNTTQDFNNLVCMFVFRPSTVLSYVSEKERVVNPRMHYLMKTRIHAAFLMMEGTTTSSTYMNKGSGWFSLILLPTIA